MKLVDVSLPTGNSIAFGNLAESGSAPILLRRVIGDNNANDRFDVGDASIMQRLLIGLETVRSWDVRGNDVNANSNLDSGDVIRVLRVVVGLDPQPQIQSASRASRLSKMDLRKAGPSPSDAVFGLVSLSPDGLRGQPGELVTVQVRLQEMATQFRVNYTESLQSLIDRAKSEHHNVVIVVFGLANIDAFFKARKKAEAVHARNPALYPYFESGYRSFESLKPPYQKNMVRLSLMMNAEMRAMVANLNRELKNYGNVRVQYSDALTIVDFSRLEMINPVDAWHPSVEGHKALTSAAFSALRPSLAFLEMEQRPMSKHQVVFKNHRTPVTAVSPR